MRSERCPLPRSDEFAGETTRSHGAIAIRAESVELLTHRDRVVSARFLQQTSVPCGLPERSERYHHSQRCDACESAVEEPLTLLEFVDTLLHFVESA